MHLRDGYAWSMPKMLRCPEELEAWSEGITMAVSAFDVGIRAGLYVDDRPELMARTMFAPSGTVRIGPPSSGPVPTGASSGNPPPAGAPPLNSRDSRSNSKAR